MTDSPSQLTPEMVAVPGAPDVPATVLPLPNAISDQQAPDQQPAGPVAPIGLPPLPTTSSSPAVSAIHDGINRAAADTPPALQGKPGQWATQILSGLSRAFSTIGETQSASEAHPGSSIFQTMNDVQNARQAKAQTQQKEMDAHEQSLASVAMSNVNRMHQQRLLHQMTDDDNHKDVADGQSHVNDLTTGQSSLGLESASIVKQGITEDQLNAGIADRSINQTKEVWYPTGTFQPIDPRTGKLAVDPETNDPIHQKTYTVLKVPKEQALSKDNIDLLNKYIPGVNLTYDPSNPDGVKLSGPQAVLLMQQARQAQTLETKRKQELAASELQALTTEQEIAAKKSEQNLAASTDYNNAYATSGGHLEATYNFMTGQHKKLGIDPKTGKPGLIPDQASIDAAKKYPNAGYDMVLSRGGQKNYDEIVEKQKKDDETERKDRAAEAEKAQAEKDKQTAQDFNPPSSANLTGDAYLKTLSIPQQNLLTSVGEGRNTTVAIQNRKGELTPLGLAVTQAFPDYDITKAKDYQKLRTDFITGPTSKALTSYGTAMNHARLLYDNTGPQSFIAGTAENKRYNQDALYVATEVAKALNPTGVASEQTIKEQVNALTSVPNRKVAIENAEAILSGKMTEIKQRWANGQVRPSYQPPMPGLSKEATDNADYVRNHGQAAAPKGIPGLPPGAIAARSNNGAGPVVGYMLNGKYVSLGAK